MLYPLSYEGGMRSTSVAAGPTPPADGGNGLPSATRRLRNMRRCPPDTVLVVDDDPVILQLLEVNFEMEGFNVLHRPRRRRGHRDGAGPTGPTSSSATS